MRAVLSHETSMSDARVPPKAVVAPHVSVVIVNRNYGAFVGQTIDSIRSQTYPWFECLIADNGSDDNSREVIRRHMADDPRFRLLEFGSNLGHLGAAFEVLGELTGEFVCFADADDFLFPDYLASHVQVHLAVSQPLAISSSNLLEINRLGQIVNGTCPWMIRGMQPGPRGLRSGPNVPRVSVLSDPQYDELSDATTLVPASTPGWLWGPGTATMYRRSLMELVRPVVSGKVQLGGVDAYFNPFIHALSGTALIDLPLSTYRIHGQNDYTVRPMMHGIQTGTRKAELVSLEVRKLLMATVLARADTVSWIMGPDRFWTAFDTMPNRLGRELSAFHAGLVDAFAQNYGLLKDVFGEQELMAQLRQRLTHRDFRRLIRKVYDDRVPLATGRIVVKTEIARHARRALRRIKRAFRMVGRAMRR